MEDEYMDLRRGMEGEAAQNARANARVKVAVKEAKDAYEKPDPELGVRGNAKNIAKKHRAQMDAFRSRQRVSKETGYAEGGMVKGKRGCGKAMKGHGKGKMY